MTLTTKQVAELEQQLTHKPLTEALAILGNPSDTKTHSLSATTYKLRVRGYLDTDWIDLTVDHHHTVLLAHVRPLVIQPPPPPPPPPPPSPLFFGLFLLTFLFGMAAILPPILIADAAPKRPPAGLSGLLQLSFLPVLVSSLVMAVIVLILRKKVADAALSPPPDPQDHEVLKGCLEKAQVSLLAWLAFWLLSLVILGNAVKASF